MLQKVIHVFSDIRYENNMLTVFFFLSLQKKLTSLSLTLMIYPTLHSYLINLLLTDCSETLLERGRTGMARSTSGWAGTEGWALGH